MDFAAAASLDAEILTQGFLAAGLCIFDEPLDPRAAGELLAQIRAARRFDETLFLSQAAFDADPQYTGVNPRPGRNLLDRFADRLGFVEDAPSVVETLTTLLGTGYAMLDRKIVCGVPARAVPPWLVERIAGNPVNNLGAYVRPDVRDVTYFYGIDFHQDLIDYKDREADFVTLYVYLHAVGAHDAPLYVLEGSHALGASVFPHDLARLTPQTWRYRNGASGEAQVRQRVLTGGAGFAALWHACTLHGTQPDAADHERISLRYVFAAAPGSTGRMREVNAALRGALSLKTTRLDLDNKGAAQFKHNAVTG